MSSIVSPPVDKNMLCKAWINFQQTGTQTINDSYNVSSIVDNGVGLTTINIDANMANSNYAITTSVMDLGAGGLTLNVDDTSMANTGNFHLRSANTSNSNFDATRVYAAVFGVNNNV